MYEATVHHSIQSGVDLIKARKIVVVSRKIRPDDYPAVIDLADGYLEPIDELKQGVGKITGLWEVASYTRTGGLINRSRRQEAGGPHDILMQSESFES